MDISRPFVCMSHGELLVDSMSSWWCSAQTIYQDASLLCRFELCRWRLAPDVLIKHYDCLVLVVLRVSRILLAHSWTASLRPISSWFWSWGLIQLIFLAELPLIFIRADIEEFSFLLDLLPLLLSEKDLHGFFCETARLNKLNHIGFVSELLPSLPEHP